MLLWNVGDCEDRENDGSAPVDRVDRLGNNSLAFLGELSWGTPGTGLS
jgi:hypothetical protein